MRRLLSILALGLCTVPAAADLYTVDFFPKLPQINSTQQLIFIGPGEGTITGARLVVEFTTLSDFSAEDLTILLVANVDPVTPNTGFWFLTGADLGWFGQGTFAADLTTSDLNGVIQPGVWAFDLGSLREPPAYSGQWGLDSRFEITIEIPNACYPDCNRDGVLNLADFGCFQTQFALGDPAADCNGDGVLNLADFGCFQTLFALGCP